MESNIKNDTTESLNSSAAEISEAVSQRRRIQIDRQLHNYCKQLERMLMFPENENEPTQLVIFAGGNREYFEHVATLIENARLLKNGKFVAFIKPWQSIAEGIFFIPSYNTPNRRP